MTRAGVSVDITPERAACVAQAIELALECCRQSFSEADRISLRDTADCLWLVTKIRRVVEKLEVSQ